MDGLIDVPDKTSAYQSPRKRATIARGRATRHFGKKAMSKDGRPMTVSDDDDEAEDPPQEAKPWRGTVEAVCYPPAGYVPLDLLESGRALWTITPDSTRFQPTSSTKVLAWRVNIDYREWTAERICELPVRGQAVDCGAEGAFCAIFWPDLGSFNNNDQIEIVLTNLRGSSTELTFFYHLVHIGRNELDRRFCAEAERIRTLLGFRELWNDPRVVNGAPCTASKETAAPGDPSNLSRRSRPARRESVGVDQIAVSLQTVSHHDLTFTTNTNDVAIVLSNRGSRTAFQALLYLVRAGGEDEVVERATQVWQLGNGYILIRVKLPMPRCRFELRLFSIAGINTTTDNPIQLKQHPLKYTIFSGDKCQTLLTSIQDSLTPKYGLAQSSLAAQRYGVIVLAPSTHRIHVGTCYFLVCVQDVAFASAREEKVSVNEKQASVQPVLLPAATMEQLTQGSADPSSALSGRSRHHVTTSLFTERLLPPRASKALTHRGASRTSFSLTMDSLTSDSKERPSENDFYTRLRETVEPRCQDSDGEMHLDVALHNGESVYRLKPHPDFRGFYEGCFVISEGDVGTQVKLSARFPQIHVSEFAQRPLAWWQVFRNEHLPLNF
jgi:hypothetical protein